MPYPLDTVWQTGRRSARRPRTTQWGEYVLRNQQPVSLQDELDALEALCFLSAGQVPDFGTQQLTHPSKPTSSKRPQHHGRQPKHPQQKSRQHKRQQLAKKQHSRQSLGSETSSGATQCGLAPAQACELQAELPMAVEDVHPAAIAGPEIMQQLLLISTHKSQQVEKQQQGAGDSSDTRLVMSMLTPMASDDYAAQSQQCSPGSQVVPASPEPMQQEPAAGATAPAAAPAAAPAQPAKMQHQKQPAPVLLRPPVKGCFWHVYIAKMIHADQQRKEREQRQNKAQQQPSTSKRAHPQQADSAAGGSLPSSKKRRTEPKSQQPCPPPQQQHGSASPGDVAGMPAGQQQAAAVQHVLVRTLLQQQQQQGTAPGLSALLGQQVPPALQLLQQAISAATMHAVPQPPAAAPTSQLDLLSGLPPAIQAAAAGCPQLLQALGAATAPHASPSGLAFGAGLQGAVAGGRFGVGGLQAAGFMGGMPAALSAPPAATAQLQALFDQGAPAAAVAAPAGWSSLGHWSAMLGGGSMPHIAAAQAGRVAV